MKLSVLLTNKRAHLRTQGYSPLIVLMRNLIVCLDLLNSHDEFQITVSLGRNVSVLNTMSDRTLEVHQTFKIWDPTVLEV